MATQTGTANDVHDLLDRLRLFALGAGYTIDFWGNRSTGNGRALTLHKGSLYATFLTSTAAGDSSNPGPYVGVYGHTGYSAGSTETQTAASTVAWSNYLPGPFAAYDFFEGVINGRPYLHAIVETTAGTFKPLGTGLLIPQGVITTGQYVFACHWDYANNQVNSATSNEHGCPFDHVGYYDNANTATAIRADMDGAVTWHRATTNSGAAPRRLFAGYRDPVSPLSLPNATSPSNLTGRAPLFPLWCAVDRGGGFWSDIGYPPDLRFVRMDRYAPRELIPLGADQWKAFPIHRKNGPPGSPNSGNYGLAFKVTP